MYLDNGICAVTGKIEVKKASAWVRDALECVGLVVHEGKSVWFLSLSTVWLGFDVDLERGCVLVPEAKLAALHAIPVICNMACIASRSRSHASVGGRRCTWVPSRDGNCGQRQGKAFQCSLCKKSTWHSYLQHLGESVES